MRLLSEKFGGCRLFHSETVLYFLMAVLFCELSFGDTFTHRKNGEVLHGYKTSSVVGVKTSVQTEEKGAVELNLAEWKMVRDRKGRKNKVVVMQLTGPIMYEIETEALEKSIVRIADEGPLFILLEIDTPGGRVDLAYRICAVITGTDNVETIVYIGGGESGGALSAGAAVSLAAAKIYMKEDSVMGAATMITGDAKTMKKAYGEEVGEKFDSAWRARLASLAEQNGRAGVLARAMVDKDIEVVEVKDKGKHFFIDPINKKPEQDLIKTWSKKGSLLTLTAAEALSCGYAEAIVASREELLISESAAQAQIVVDNEIQQAGEELRRAQGQLKRIRKRVDYAMKKSEGPMYRAEALKLLRDARGEFKTLLNLARKYPDLKLDTRLLEDELNSIEATYRNMKRRMRRR